ncbi:MAG: DUF6364 family protein [Acidobacteriota bacterium]|nr:DUF6364 family protein [Acidobacteriota bacterium]
MTAKQELTIRLSTENLKFLKRFAREHGLTATEVLGRYLTRLREASIEQPAHPRVESISGLVPSDLEARTSHMKHLAKKHG